MNLVWGGVDQLFWVVVKAALLYVTAVLGFRLGERRTLAELSAFDFIAAVAVGAIVGRVPNSATTSYLEGAATLITILISHRVVARLRYFPPFASLVDHPPRLLVANGRILEREVRNAGLTRDDLHGILRQHGFASVDQVDLVIFEQRGKVSVVPTGAGKAGTRDLLDEVAAKHRDDNKQS